MNLVLSLFPGIGLLDEAFEEAGFCVVRGPDLLWGGDVHRFHPPVRRFDGMIGGPPCQAFSRLRHLVHQNGLTSAPNLIPEFERCVGEGQPGWWLMENVPDAPEPTVDGYEVRSFTLNNRWVGGEQNRIRRFSFGSRNGADLRSFVTLEALEAFAVGQAVCASGCVKPGIPTGRTVRAKYLGWKTAEALRESIRLQGLPDDFLSKAPFTLEGKHRVVGNGVPLPMGRAIAAAVKKAISDCGFQCAQPQ
jgi:DNA (cytosine-5)-methyltransferase 1